MTLETWELMSYVVTVVGLPLAIFVFLFEQRKERENEEEEVYQLLADNFTMLMSLFERAYPLLYQDDMSPDFRSSLPRLLHGENPSFVRYVERLAASPQA